MVTGKNIENSALLKSLSVGTSILSLMFSNTLWANDSSCLEAPISSAGLAVIFDHVPEKNQYPALARLVSEALPAFEPTNESEKYFNEVMKSLLIAALSESKQTKSLEGSVTARVPIICAVVSASTKKHSDHEPAAQPVSSTDGGAPEPEPPTGNSNAKPATVQNALEQKLEDATEANTLLQKIEYAHRQLLALADYEKTRRPFLCGKWSSSNKCEDYLTTSRTARTSGLEGSLKAVLKKHPDLNCQELIADADVDFRNSFDSGKAILPCSHFLTRLMSNRYLTIEESATAAAALSKDATETKLIQQLKRDATPRYANVISLEARRDANYGLFAGPSMVLQEDGSWDAGTEIVARFETEVFPSNFFICPSRMKWCRASTEINFMTPGTKFSKEVENQENLPVNPFDSTGRLQARFNYRMHFNDWAGIEFGIGLTSPINDAFEFNRIEPRVQLGTHFQTVFTDGVLGSVSIGVAHDRFREVIVTADDPGTMDVDETVRGKEFNRFYADANILFPSLKLGGWRLAANVKADWPIDGNQEADLRTSILFYYPFNDWLDGFRPKTSGN